MITENLVYADVISVLENVKNGQYDLTILENKKTDSVSLSLLGYASYLQDRKNYLKTLQTLKDAKSLAELGNDYDGLLLYEYVFGKVLKNEKSDKEALMHFRNAERLCYEKDNFNILADITEEVRAL